MPVLKDKYQAEIAPALMKKFEYKSPMQIPKLDKIVINVGCGAEAADQHKEEEEKRVFHDTCKKGIGQMP